MRDQLLGGDSKDLDVEVFGLSADALEAILRRLGQVNTVGRSFGVLKWRPPGVAAGSEVDVSIPRRDSKDGPGHRGIAVEGDPWMSQEEAARRRDLTVNAISFDLRERAIVDPFNGRDDLERGLLRAVDEKTFLEDPLRALRVAQFSARLGFQPVPELTALCRQAPLDELPAERVQGEWQKLLLKASKPSLGMRFARDAGILERVFPEAARANQDALLDAMVPARDRQSPDGRRWTWMLTAWLRGLDREAVLATLDRLWLHRVGPYPTRERTLAAIEHLGDPIADDAAIRWLSTRAEVSAILDVREAAGEDVRPAREAATRLGILYEAPTALLQGRAVRQLLPPGPLMGRLLQHIYAKQLDGAVTDVASAMGEAERWVALLPEHG